MKKFITLILIGLVGSIVLAEEVEKKGTQTEIQGSSKGKGMRRALTNPIYSEKEPSVSPEEAEKARRDREERLKEMGYTPEKAMDVPVKEEDIQQANQERNERLKKMGIDPNAPKRSILSEKEPSVSPEEAEKARKDREERLKEMGYTPEKAMDVPVKEEDIQQANQERNERLKKMGIDPNAPKKADIPSDYKPILPSKEELERAYKIFKEKQIEDQKKLFQKAMEYKDKGELEKALETFEEMMDTGNSPVIEEAVKEMVKIQAKLGLLEQIEPQIAPTEPGRKLSPDEVSEAIKNSPKELELIKKKREKEMLKDEK